jgi:hypothetical protein
MPFNEATDLEPGRPAHAVSQAIDTLRNDGELVDWLEGDATDVILDGHGSEDIPSRALLVEDVVGGSTQSAAVERVRITLQVTPLVSRSVYRVTSPRYLAAVRDRAIATLRRDGLGSGYRYLGALDSLSLPEPETASDIDAVMEHMGRVQFAADVVRNTQP